jgi:hypothetical protein
MIIHTFWFITTTTTTNKYIIEIKKNEEIKIDIFIVYVKN